MSPKVRIVFPRPGGEGINTTSWAGQIIKQAKKMFEEDEKNEPLRMCLRDLTAAFTKDKVELSTKETTTPYSISNPESQYQARFRIPPSTIADLSQQKRLSRAERFAIGSLICNIETSREPFEEVEASIVQENFASGKYPNNMSIPLEILVPMLGFWSQEFADAYIEQLKLRKPLSSTSALFSKELIQRTPVSSNQTNAGNHALRRAVAVGGMETLGLASLVVPVLGIAGFSAIGPVASSAAAAWQSSLGLVQAGSSFATFQSVAMGGAATAIMAAQGVGGAVAGLALLDEFLSGVGDKEAAKKEAWALFLKNVRKA